MIEISLSAPNSAVATVIRETSSYGGRLLETGGFLFSPVDSNTLTGVALAGNTGIIRHRQLFQISERALDRLFTFADDRGFWIPVQFHSHEKAAFMSKTDARDGLRVEGFTSTVIPEFAAPTNDVRSWGWWQFRGGDWHRCTPVTTYAGEIDLVVVFDEDGVHEP